MQPYASAFLVIVYYIVTAALVLLPNTFSFRLFMLPITLHRAVVALQHFDIVELFGDARLNYLNFTMFGSTMAMMCMKVLVWTFCGDTPLQRPKSSTKSFGGIRSFVRDVFDLCINQRGIGWAWSRSYKPPSHTKPTSSTPRFLLYTFFSFIIHNIISDCAHYLIQSTDWKSFTDPHGAPLFNPRLSLIPRYTVSTINSAMTGVLAYCSLQITYDVLTIIGILLFGYSPVDWPPLFNEPWKSTSLADFWANRWHQIFRTPFINLGNKPLAYIFGRKSGVSMFGGFFVSSLLHIVWVWRKCKPSDFIFGGGFFIVQAVGVLLEFKVFGGKVGGWKGWIWTMVWLGVWSNMMTHAWFLHGYAASAFIPDAYRPSIVVSDFVRNLIL